MTHKPSADDLAFAGAFEALKIMLKHYSAQVLFSAEARAGFVKPDIAHIPEH